MPCTHPSVCVCVCAHARARACTHMHTHVFIHTCSQALSSPESVCSERHMIAPLYVGRLPAPSRTPELGPLHAGLTSGPMQSSGRLIWFRHQAWLTAPD